MLRRLAGLVATAALLAGCSSTPPPPDELAQEMFDLANEERVAQGVEPVEWSDCLEEKAADRAEPFIDDPDLEHETLMSSCHEGAKAGENLARSNLSAAEVVEAWMNSAGHRANLLDADFTIGAVTCVLADPGPEGEDSGMRACSFLYEGESPE
ncbi:CAP domain-containing protein [Demequina mangrovi]|uniref:Cysteine-rich secretory protein family protein n=1 Tax=Demequina mangrovi TaxID=1043493 RepID=A0A1H6YUY5_9MICO|nr:CAP domain-containing protein [Demequina mangrovi]SEJ41142.1 Cysteine-rich secretory protein family protein [Demequina mangrovi]